MEALTAFQALSQDTRLDVFRLLMRAAPNAISAGDIAGHFNVRQNTMSSHLSILAQAGLIEARREGRTINYRAKISGIQGVLVFLTEDCCGGNPKQCQMLIHHISCTGDAETGVVPPSSP